MKARELGLRIDLAISYFAGSVVMLVVLLLASCQKTEVPVQSDKVVVPTNFNFETTHATNLNLKVLDFQDKPVSGVVWNAYYTNPYDEFGNISESAQKVSTFISDYEGAIQSLLSIPGHISQLYLTTAYPGYPTPVTLDTNTPNLALTIYPAGHAGNVLKSATADISKFSPTKLFDNVYALSTFDSQGLPAYREATRDVISQQFKSNITASLPEYRRLPTSVNKSFLEDASKSNIQLTDKCEVWVTFVTEGAGYRNSLGYFYYPTNTLPAKVADIAKKYIVFPNTSLIGSSGSLVEGDKVKLRYFDESSQTWSDVFPANYTISWFIVPNGFTNLGGIGKVSINSYSIIYTLPSFNAAGLQQAVILYDDTEQKMLIAFEDQERNAKGTSGDEDFNDAVFYATANPITAINIERFNKIIKPVDTDGDGIYDQNDEYPNDPKRAYNSYYPAQNTWGTLVYEDKWPVRGDYDFNDVVVDYNTTIVKNASGLVVDVNTNYRFRAAGASYKNAFAVQFNTSPSNVESVSGQRLTANVFAVESNGVEAGQTKAVVPIVDRVNDLFGGQTMVNTILSSAKLPYVTVPVNVTFKSAVSLSSLGSAPYNPFIVVDEMRGKEVHLPGQQPTDLVSLNLLSTGIDLTNFSLNRFYVADQSYPWALHIPELFDYPIEQHAIDEVFYNFGKWVTSGGVLSPGWYLNTSTNANQTLIYK
ncbi:MAG: LruC domain-containing protein [Bacteroidales bacterium]